jgi:hypothetical protein
MQRLSSKFMLMRKRYYLRRLSITCLAFYQNSLMWRVAAGALPRAGIASLDGIR